MLRTPWYIARRKTLDGKPFWRRTVENEKKGFPWNFERQLFYYKSRFFSVT